MTIIKTTSFIRLVCALLGTLAVPTAQAQQLDLGAAGQYAAFILQDASGLAKVHGRLAVGRDLDASRLELGDALEGSDALTPSLVVRRRVTHFSDGAILNGAGRKGYGVVGVAFAEAGAEIDLRKETMPFDFDAEAMWLTMLSARLGALPASGTVQVQGGLMTLRGSNAPLEVFHLTAAQAASNATLQLANVAAGAWVLVNVASDKQRDVRLRLNQDALRPHQPRTLFNFPDAESLRLDGARVWASLLAPAALATGEGGAVEGTVVVSDWKGRAEIGHAPFVAGP
jgi:choice-of-anchor A domain-containing protein